MNSITRFWKKRPARWELIFPLVVIAATIVFEAVNYLTSFTAEKLVPQFATSAQYVIGRMVFLLCCGLLLLWCCLTRYLSWKSKGVLLASIAGLAGIGFASIRSIENTGNNKLVIHYRWEKTQDQRLAEFKKSSSAAGTTIVPLDQDAPKMTDFLGPERDGIVEGPQLETELEGHPPKEIWRRPAGESYASAVIAGGLAVTIEQRGDEEVVVAWDIKDGSDRWAYGYKAHFKEAMGGDGPRATPTIAGDEVFALGADGQLTALDLASGKLKWTTNILMDAKADNIKWGMSGSPLVTTDKVIVNAGVNSKSDQKISSAVIAYSRTSGEKVWCSGDSPASYSTPRLVTIHGQPQVLIFDGVGLGSYALEDGQQLWRYEFASQPKVEVCQPLVLPGNQVFVSVGYDTGALLVQVERRPDGSWNVEEVWRNKNMKCKMGSCVYHDGYIYGLDDGIFACLDAATGKRKWRGGRYGHGQFVLRGDVFVVQTEESGDVVFVAADPTQHRELARIPALPAGKTWNAPALAGNQLLLRNHFEAVLFELPLK